MVFVGAAFVASLGCRNTGSNEVGELTFAIALPDSTEVHSVDWVLHSSGGAVIEMGSIDTTNAKVTASLAAVLPAGTGDTITMSGTSTAGVLCTGTSQAFDVLAGGTTMVSVNMICGSVTPDGGTGMVVVTSTIVAGDSCPLLTTSLIEPRVTAIASPIHLTATASDADMGDTLTFTWSATAGTFTDPSMASTDYHCPSTTGMQSLTLRIADNHMPVPCTTVVTFPAVDCE